MVAPTASSTRRVLRDIAGDEHGRSVASVNDCPAANWTCLKRQQRRTSQRIGLMADLPLHKCWYCGKLSFVKLALMIFAVVLFGAVVCYLAFFPRNTFITFSLLSGRSVTFSPTSVKLEPLPDRYPTNGFAHVKSYLSRLQRSPQRRASVIMATADGQHALLVMRDAGQTLLSVSADTTKNTGEETNMVQFFSERGMRPSRDYLSANGGVPNSERTCEYPLTGSADAAAELCISVFTNLFGATDTNGLEFTTDGLPKMESKR